MVASYGQFDDSVLLACTTSRLGLSVYRLLRPLVFRLDAESAHSLALLAARIGAYSPKLLRAVGGSPDPRLGREVFGLRFASPVGLAAGADKNAEHVSAWAALGFGFADVGSVTALPSDGNAKPRAFRLPEDGAVINRMGLNNDGAEAVARRLASARRPVGFPLSVNIAKTHSHAIMGDAAVDDFRTSVRHLLPFADLLTLNVSCPNTAEGKTFETPDALDALLAGVFAERKSLESHVPVLVKLSPPAATGLDEGAVDELVSISLRHGVAGFVATNTASDRVGLATPAGRLREIGNGGLSGRPIARRAEALIRYLYKSTGGTIPLIGVGGIDSPDEAYHRIRSGATLVELYTGLIYDGPGLIRRIHSGLVRLLDRDGFASISEAVGLDA